MLIHKFTILFHWPLPQLLLCVDTKLAVIQCHALPAAPLNKQQSALIAPSV